MRNKITDGRISYGQYKLADIMLFLLITCVCEAINVFAVQRWFQGMLFSVSVMLLVTLVVLVRWNWVGVIFPIADGLIYCWMNGATAAQFVIYPIGNAFVAVVGLLFLAVPKEKITSRWFFVVLYAIAGFVLLVLGRTIVSACFGQDFGKTLVAMLTSESLNLVFAVVGLLILRLPEGMLTDQKKYLFKLAKERDTVKHAEEYHWDGYTELNEDDLRALASMDEYDKAISFSKSSLKRLKEHDGHELSEAQAEDERELSEEEELSRLDGE